MFLLTLVFAIHSFQAQLLHTFTLTSSLAPEEEFVDVDVRRPLLITGTSGPVFGRVLLVCHTYTRNEDVFFASTMFRRIPDIIPESVVISVAAPMCRATLAQLDSTALVEVLAFGHGFSSEQLESLPQNHTKLQLLGEVFGSQRCSPKLRGVIHVFRAKTNDSSCVWLHFLQFASMLHGFYTKILPNAAPFVPFSRERTYNEALLEARAKTGFAGFAFGKFRLLIYHGDYVVRHAFVHLLRNASSARQIDSLGHFSSPGFHKVACNGSYVHEAVCFRPYKFAIVMENSAFPGYVSEKLLNAFLAYTVPVYFGATDIGTYINKDAIVECRVTEEELMVLRAAQHSNYNFLAGTNASHILEWAVVLLERSLRSCVDEVLWLDANDDAYVKKLMAHPLAQRRARDTYVDGFSTSCELLQLLDARDSMFVRNRSSLINACHTVLK